MVDAASLRDSTQIVLPRDALAGVEVDVEEEFVVSVLEEGEQIRIVGSPVVIREVSDFLCRNGITVP
ncbi:MAG: hypothetical protein ABEJ77_02240 [Halanaeroarchaeum sp.]